MQISNKLNRGELFYSEESSSLKGSAPVGPICLLFQYLSTLTYPRKFTYKFVRGISLRKKNINRKLKP